MKRLIYGLIIPFALLLLLAIPSSAEDKPQPPEKKASVWMEQKLLYSKVILEGLTEENYEKIQLGAKAMSYLGHLEKWAHSDRPDYQRELKNFELANQLLIKQAQKKNLEATTFAYTLLTVSCVRCHDVVRNVNKPANP
jgi:hypothetical protein